MRNFILLLIMFCFYNTTNAQVDTSCVVPKPTAWKNPYKSCDKVNGVYNVQFFSTRMECMVPIPFPYKTGEDDCLIRYYYDAGKDMNYCEALEALKVVRETFPDAFPKKQERYQ